MIKKVDLILKIKTELFPQKSTVPIETVLMKNYQLIT